MHASAGSRTSAEYAGSGSVRRVSSPRAGVRRTPRSDTLSRRSVGVQSPMREAKRTRTAKPVADLPSSSIATPFSTRTDAPGAGAALPFGLNVLHVPSESQSLHTPSARMRTSSSTLVPSGVSAFTQAASCVNGSA